MVEHLLYTCFRHQRNPPARLKPRRDLHGTKHRMTRASRNDIPDAGNSTFKSHGADSRGTENAGRRCNQGTEAGATAATRRDSWSLKPKTPSRVHTLTAFSGTLRPVCHSGGTCSQTDSSPNVTPISGGPPIPSSSTQPTQVPVMFIPEPQGPPEATVLSTAFFCLFLPSREEATQFLQRPLLGNHSQHLDPGLQPRRRMY